MLLGVKQFCLRLALLCLVASAAFAPIDCLRVPQPDGRQRHEPVDFAQKLLLGARRRGQSSLDNLEQSLYRLLLTSSTGGAMAERTKVAKQKVGTEAAKTMVEKLSAELGADKPEEDVVRIRFG